MSRSHLRHKKQLKANHSARVLPSAVAEMTQPSELMLVSHLREEEKLDCESLQGRADDYKAVAVSLRPRKAELAQILWRRLDTVRRMTSNTDACFIVGGALRLLETTDKLCPCTDDVAVAALLSTAVALSHPDQGYDLKAGVSSDTVRDALRRSAGQSRLSAVLDAECYILASTRTIWKLPAEFLNSAEGSTHSALSWQNAIGQW